MLDKVKCFYCASLALENKTTGTCSHVNQKKESVAIAEQRLCKDYKLAPMHNVNWRRKAIRK